MKLSGSVQAESDDLSAILRQLPRPVRLSLGIAGSAFLAFYVPLVAVTATGIWANRIMMWEDVFIETGILMVVSVLGLVLKRLWAVAIFASITFLIYITQHFLRSPQIFDLGTRWADFFHPVAGFLLNAWLVQRYIRAVDPLTKNS